MSECLFTSVYPKLYFRDKPIKCHTKTFFESSLRNKAFKNYLSVPSQGHKWCPNISLELSIFMPPRTLYYYQLRPIKMRVRVGIETLQRLINMFWFYVPVLEKEDTP